MTAPLRHYRADLHVHTALSPCASETMVPRTILEAARARGIDLIGVVDHNAAGNARAMMEAMGRQAAGERVHVLPGVEAESAEGVHALCLCDRAEEAEEMAALLQSSMPELANRPEAFGEQSLVDADGCTVGRETRLLLQATRMSFRDICGHGLARGLLMIAAHATRRGHGLLGVLGFVPEGTQLDALESGQPGPGRTGEGHPDLARWPLIYSSDAHRAEDIGGFWTDLWLAEPSVAEIKLALRGEGGRRVRPHAAT
jgi:PHP family Zn ribbon phosphoesterase